MRIWWIAVLGIVARAQDLPVPTIKVPVRLVTAPTLVFSENDRLVFGLESGDFQVYDNGHTQKATVDTELPRLSVVLAVEANQDVRAYTRFIARVGSAADALLVGERGEGACRVPLLTSKDSAAVDSIKHERHGKETRCRRLSCFGTLRPGMRCR